MKILAVSKQMICSSKLEQHYLDHIEDEVTTLTTYKGDTKKPNKQTIMQWVDDHFDVIEKADTLIICDADYFKALSKQTNTLACIGYKYPFTYKEYTIDLIYLPNYQGIFYNPDLTETIKQVIQVINEGSEERDPITYAEYYLYDQHEDVQKALDELLVYEKLYVDIETFSLKHYKAGIATISFAINKHEGIAFAVDYNHTKPIEDRFQINIRMHSILRSFFSKYKGTCIFHNCTFDIKCLIYTLFMKNLNHTQGINTGLRILCNNFEDTKIIAYLSKNSCSRPNLSLKALSHEYVGNYALDEINDVRTIDIHKLLKYNLTDCVATAYVYEKYYPVLIQDNQLDVYLNIFKPSLKTIIGMELTGVCLYINRVHEVKKILEDKLDLVVKEIQGNVAVKDWLNDYRQSRMEADYQARVSKAKNKDKIKYKPIEAFDNIEFNPNSGDQVASLLYEYFKLPVLGKTKNGNPSTEGKVLAKLVHHTEHEFIKQLLNNLCEYTKIEKILTSFIPSFLESVQGTDGNYYMFGSFNLGGTVSGRLSSSNPVTLFN